MKATERRIIDDDGVATMLAGKEPKVKLVKKTHDKPKSSPLAISARARRKYAIAHIIVFLM
jgi:hypothetical protein